jgi:hypothetical protein
MRMIRSEEEDKMARGKLGGSEIPGSERDVLLHPWFEVQNEERRAMRIDPVRGIRAEYEKASYQRQEGSIDEAGLQRFGLR